MIAIEDFREIRRDGKAIDESMSVEDIFALGAPEKIIEVQWKSDSRPIFLKNSHGVLAKVIYGKQFVAVNEYDGDGKRRTLSIVNADGSRRLQLSNTQTIRGKDEAGEFCWFEPARVESKNVFGVVFRRFRDNSMFQLDIDAIDGHVISVYPMQ